MATHNKILPYININAEMDNGRVAFPNVEGDI